MITLILVMAVLAVAVLMLLLLPVLRGSAALPGRAGYDTAVYRDQLKELERDIGRGLISEAEAQSARLEIERRLLAAAAATGDGAARSGRSLALAAVLALLVAGGAAGLYARIGAPGVPDTAFALRVAGHGQPGGDQNHPDMAKLAKALGDKLRSDPNNAEGWLLYARTLATMGNFQGSADAYRNRIALGEVNADTYAGYGEMLVLGSDGVVTPAAREAFDNALKQEPGNAIARFYMALSESQQGHGQQAIDAWVKLAGETADPAMRQEIQRRVVEAAKLGGLKVPELPPAPAAPPATADAGPEAGQAPGPDAAAMAAAANMTDQQRADMIKGMVAQLEEKLKEHPDDAEGWMRLGRAYAVMAEHDKAAAAYQKAAALRPNDASVLLQGVNALIAAQKPEAPIPQRAVDLLRQAERVDGKRPEVLWYLGLAEAQSGHVAKAQGYWKQLLELLPADSKDRKMVADAIAAVKKE